MAPVPVEPELRYTGAALVSFHILSALYFTQQVASSLVQSYRSLSPAQDVRNRLERRRKLVPVFTGLALMALSISLYAGWAYASLSFNFWAQQRGVGVSEQVLVFSELSEAAATNSSKMQSQPGADSFLVDMVRWLSDAPIYQDAFEITVEKARRFWWAQQVDLALIPWSTLVAVEGSRRGIPNLFAFQALAHLVNLSFAQNLFFVALLLTPSPLPRQTEPHSRLAGFFNRAFPAKPRNWSLRPGVLFIFVIGSYTTILSLPYASETPFFSRVLGATRLLTFAPLVLQTVAPTSWGTVHSNQTKVDPALTDLFRFMSVMTVVLHGVATFSGLRYNIPHAHYHRHSKLLPWDIEERSRWERTTSAVGKVLGATRDHPVVSGVGYDVLLSGLSVGLWAAVRSLGADDILDAVVPLYKRGGEDAKASGRINEVSNSDTKHSENDAASARSSRRTKGRSRKADEDEHEPPTPRRRGRPRRAKQEDGVVQEPGDNTYEPSPEERVSVQRGDALPGREVDLEAAGLAWGLISVGGLGLGSAGVFGGECLAW